MNIFRFFDFRRSKKQAQTWKRVEPAKAFGTDEMPEASVSSHLVSPVVKAGPKSRLFIKPLDMITSIRDGRKNDPLRERGK